jgi:DNA-binding transcriptional LysR family regulator
MPSRTSATRKFILTAVSRHDGDCSCRAVPIILRDFPASHPDVAFALVQDSHDTMLAKLRASTIDLCLTAPPPDEPGLRTRTLDRQHIALVVPRGHRLARRRRIRLADVADETFVGLEPGYGLRRITDEYCRQAGFEPRLAFEGQEIDTLLGLVATGLGVALLPIGLTRPRRLSSSRSPHPAQVGRSRWCGWPTGCYRRPWRPSETPFWPTADGWLPTETLWWFRFSA